MPPDRRGGDRRVRQVVYHDVERRSTDRRAPRDVIARDPAEKPGIITWTAIALLAFFLIDGFAWEGKYRQQVVHAFNEQVMKVRDAGANVWVKPVD